MAQHHLVRVIHSQLPGGFQTSSTEQISGEETKFTNLDGVICYTGCSISLGIPPAALKVLHSSMCLARMADGAL
jgi:hypothetical protein